MNTKIIVTVCAGSVLLAAFATAQALGQKDESKDSASVRLMLSNQPNHTAMQQFVFSEGFGGFGAASKVSKLGSQHIEVTDDTIFITETGQPTVKVFPKRREYVVITAEKANEFAAEPEELAKRNDMVFRSMGTEKVGEYDCLKIEATYLDERLKEVKFLFWAAPELKNLVIRSEISLSAKVKFVTLLSEISLNVDEKLFRVPEGYKKVEEPANLRYLQERNKRPF